MALAEAVAYGVAAVVMMVVFYVALELAAAGARGVARWGRGLADITVRGSVRTGGDAPARVGARFGPGEARPVPRDKATAPSRGAVRGMTERS